MKMILGFVLLATLTSMVWACDATAPGGGSAIDSPRELAAASVNSSHLQADVSTCNIASGCAVDGILNGGVFRVDGLNTMSGNTTARLVLVKHWGAQLPDQLDLPMNYDSAPSTDPAGLARLNASLTGVKDGEELAIIFGHSTADGPCWGANTIFRKSENGGFTNGTLFTSEAWSLDQIAAVLTKNVQQQRDGEACSPNIKSDVMPEQPAFDDPGTPGPPASSVPLPDDFDPDGPQGSDPQ